MSSNDRPPAARATQPSTRLERTSEVPVGPPRRLVEVTVDGTTVKVAEGDTLLAACAAAGVDTPTLCYGPTIEPANACRVCVVELEGSRPLVPACSRRVEPGMVVHTGTERVARSRKLVLELLGSSVDLSTTPAVERWTGRYCADPSRFGDDAAAVRTPVKDDNDLYVREYGKCVLCYRCVDACGAEWQHTFAIAIAGRGFDAHVSTEYDVGLPDSACVYCGNCIAVCPTGALVPRTEWVMRAAGEWDEQRQTTTDTICPFCGVGCNVTLHVQDNRIVKVTSPEDHPITHGNLCIKGRFGYEHVHG
jgi:predicted molibdopterin-dependent oxidoreductase YjgC